MLVVVWRECVGVCCVSQCFDMSTVFSCFPTAYIRTCTHTHTVMYVGFTQRVGNIPTQKDGWLE